jgi:hypothetical protein
MADKEIDLLGDAFRETENEMFDSAVGKEEDESTSNGDRSLEEMDDPTGFSAEPKSDDEAGDDDDGDDDGDEGGEPEKPEARANADDRQEQPGKAQEPAQEAQDNRRRVPIGEHVEVRKRAQSAEAERDALKAKLAEQEQGFNSRFDALQRDMAVLRQPAPQQPQPQQPKKEAPDMFADPEGWRKHMQEEFRQELAVRDAQIQRQAFDTSLRLARVKYGTEFEEADKAAGELNPNDPTTRVVQQRIMASSDPGEEAVRWYREQKAIREIGPDPAAYRARTEAAVRENLMKDPEFRKQLLADLQAEARGQNGRPNTIIRTPQHPRVPPSLSGASGGGRAAPQLDPSLYDDSESGVFEFATAIPR